MDVPDPPLDDRGDVTLAILLTRRQAWLASVTRNGRSAFAVLIPAAGSAAGWWLGTVESPGEGTRGSADPVPAAAVAFTLRYLGFDLDGADWMRDGRFGEEPANPYLANDPRTVAGAAG